MDANGWEQPGPHDVRPDGVRADALRSGPARPGSSHASHASHADGGWSAGAREPAMEPIPSWRRSAVTQLTDRPEQPRRLADLLAPVSPPAPPPFPFDGAAPPDGQFSAPEPGPVAPAPTPPVNGSTDYPVDRSFPPDGGRPDPRELDAHQPESHHMDGRQAWAPRTRPVVDDPAVTRPDRFSAFDGYRPAPPAPAPFDDLPALAEAAPVTRTGHGGDAQPEPDWSASSWPDSFRPLNADPSRPVGTAPAAGPRWAVPASGEPAPVPAPPAAAGPHRVPVPTDRHRYEPAAPDSAQPDGPSRYNGSANRGAEFDGPPRFNGTAPVSPAVPFHGGASPAHPEPAVHPEAAPAHAEPVPDAGPAPAGPLTAPAPVDPAASESVLDDPWADPARYAAVYRESMSAIRAASVGFAAAEARAAAEDHAAIQAAYSAAVDSRPVDSPAHSEPPDPTATPGPATGGPATAPEPTSGNTPLGQPSLADYAERPTGAYRSVPPREAVIPRQHGPADQLAPLGRPAQAAHRNGDPSSHAAPSGRPQTIQATPLSQAAHPAQPGPSDQPERSAPPGHPAAGHPTPAGPPAPVGRPAPPRQPAPGRPGGQGPSALPVPPVLPQRIPAAPDVPEVPDDLADDDFVDHGPDLAAVNPPELARIATGLRYNEDLEEPPRPDGFDTLAVLAAVRAVPGVRDAQLRPNPTGAGVHTLRLDLADGADGAQVSRLVARLLKQRMGLAAEPRRSSDARRATMPAAPNTGQPHREAVAMPVAGASPAPRVPMPTSAAEQLGGPVAANASDDRSRRRAVPAGRGRTLEQDEPHRVIRSATAPRVVIDQVQVSTLGLDATVEVRLTSGGTPAIGVASGPAVDGYVLRLAAVAATAALDQLLATVDSWEQPGRCFVEHATVVPFGSVDVAVVVLLLVCGTTAEQLTGSALVQGDPRQAVVRATLAAMNRRLDTLLS
jgi:hypothetical protein